LKYLAAGFGTFGYEPNVRYFFGFPQAITPGGIALDIRVTRVLGNKTVDPEAYKNLSLQTGILSSTLEHAVPEQMFTTDPNNPVQAVSAVKAIQLAQQQGQRIYHITQANKATALPNIGQNIQTLNDIQNALAVGKEVITHTNPISVPGWTGAGYIIFDPDTGEGAYRITGGGNGGFIVGAIIFSLLILTISLFPQVLLLGVGQYWTGVAAVGVMLANELIILNFFLEYYKKMPSDIRDCFWSGFMLVGTLGGYWTALVESSWFQAILATIGGVDSNLPRCFR